MTGSENGGSGRSSSCAPFIERARTFSGWNFDDLRRHAPLRSARTPWDYVALAREHAASIGRVIDLGTGGGEVYSRIVAGCAARFVASEEWHVNAPVARDRLRPLGVDVVRDAQQRDHVRGPTRRSTSS